MLTSMFFDDNWKFHYCLIRFNEMQLKNFYRFNNVLNKNLTLLDWNNGDDRLPNHLDSQYCEHNTSKRMKVVNSQSIDFGDENTFIP